jgi:hypothetical protein
MLAAEAHLEQGGNTVTPLVYDSPVQASFHAHDPRHEPCGPLEWSKAQGNTRRTNLGKSANQDAKANIRTQTITTKHITF